jgi:DNA polymerase-3 subunit chi
VTEIKFYVGRGNTLRSRLLLACQLTQKAREHNLHVYIHVDTEKTLQLMDNILWEYRDDSFIPHAFAPDQDVFVEMGYDYQPIEQCDYLINLSNERPDFFSRFSRMAEVLDQQEDVLIKGRDRYRFYQDRGYKLDYHKL